MDETKLEQTEQTEQIEQTEKTEEIVAPEEPALQETNPAPKPKKTFGAILKKILKSKAFWIVLALLVYTGGVIWATAAIEREIVFDEIRKSLMDAFFG